ncbi:MAG: ABC transporter substrate-binding protein [Alphaproteobacteria bacterium]|nr:ABC transporter substrate-binding protein [Alphaproteobacteria bacterium]
MKKWLLSLCMILTLIACKDEKNSTDSFKKPVIKIGATLPLSGNLSYVGIGAQNALNIVIDKWKEKNTKYSYQIIFEDDVVKPQQAALNTHKFINVDKANVVVSVFGIVDRAVDEIANQNNVISLSCSYGKDVVPEYGLNTAPQNKEIYASALRELKKRNVKTVALLGSNAAVSNVLLGYAAEHLPSDGIEVVFNDRYNVGETDFRLSIQKMEQSAPDYYLIFGVEPMNSIFVKQYHELTGKNNLASLGSFANISLDVFPPVNGVWSVYQLSSNEDFEKAYFNKYQNRVEVCSANLYDGLDMIIEAFENTPKKEGEDIPNNADVLQTIKNFKIWKGTLGEMKIEPNGIVEIDVQVRMYNDGQWVKIEE